MSTPHMYDDHSILTSKIIPRLKDEISFLFTLMEFIEKAIFQENAYSVFSRDDLLEILDILGVPLILPDEEGVEHHVTFEFKGEARNLIVYMEKSYWSVPYCAGDEYDEYEVVGYEIFISHDDSVLPCCSPTVKCLDRGVRICTCKKLESWGIET